MALLSDADRQAVRDHLATITHPVTLLFFTQTFGEPETARLTKQIVDELASLSDQVTVEEVNFILDKDRAAQYGIADIPAIVLLRDGEDTRMRFLGTPAGYEFVSLIEAVLVAGMGDSGLSDASRALIRDQVSEPVNIQVFVTPT
jgi:alkyl hydroperoxide reductase subunit AhpF